MVKAWWFSEGKILPHGDGRRIAVGRTHKVEGDIIPCCHGLHASVRALDALRYAPGPIVWRVELGGTVVPDDDKFAASERTYLAGGIDVSDTLRAFARRCALDVIHLWKAPEVVVRYLRTGDKEIHRAAIDAIQADGRHTADWSCSAAFNATGADAEDAAWHAASDAATAGSRVDAREKQNRRLTAMLTHAIRRAENG